MRAASTGLNLPRSGHIESQERDEEPNERRDATHCRLSRLRIGGSVNARHGHAEVQHTSARMWTSAATGKVQRTEEEEESYLNAWAMRQDREKLDRMLIGSLVPDFSPTIAPRSRSYTVVPWECSGWSYPLLNAGFTRSPAWCYSLEFRAVEPQPPPSR